MTKTCPVKKPSQAGNRWFRLAMAHDNPWHGIGFSRILGVWPKKRKHDACTTHLPWDWYVYLRGWLIHVYYKLVGKYTVDGRNPANQLRLVVYPTTRFYTSQVVSQTLDFFLPSTVPDQSHGSVREEMIIFTNLPGFSFTFW